MVTTTVASTTPASSSPARPTSSAPAKPTNAGAVALASRAIAALNTLYQKQDPGPLNAISVHGGGANACGDCAVYIKAITTKAKQGYRFSGGVITQLPPAVGSYDPRDNTDLVTTFVSVTALHVTDPHGTPYNSDQDPAGGGSASPRTEVDWDMSWGGTRWLVSGFNSQEAPR